MAYKIEDQIRIIRKGQAIRAQYPIPPGVAGHDPDYRSSIAHDPRAANALLDRFGYKKGPDGYRRMPNGEPLVIRYSSTPSERDRQFDELMKRSLDSIGLRLEIHKDRFPELIKLENQCRLMMRGAAWIADYPDGDNFMQLLYGPNSGQSNNACYRSPEYDKRYEKSRLLPHGPERDRLYREMTRIMETDTVWLLTDSRYRNVLLQPGSRASRSTRCCTPSGSTWISKRSELPDATAVAIHSHAARRGAARVHPVQLGRRRSGLHARRQDRQPGADREHPAPDRRRPALLGAARDLHQADRDRRLRRELVHQRARIADLRDPAWAFADRSCSSCS